MADNSSQEASGPLSSLGPDYPSHGLSEPASVAANAIATAQYDVVAAAGYTKAARAGGAVTTVVIGVVDVVDAYQHGTTIDVAVQTTGIGGALAGGAAGAWLGAELGALLGPWGAGIGAFGLSVFGAYLGEEAIQRLANEMLGSSDSSDTTGHSQNSIIPDGIPARPEVNFDASVTYHYTDPDTDKQVKTTIIRDLDTGEERATTTTVLSSNPTSGIKSDLLNGNSYPTGSVQVAYELTELDKIAIEQQLEYGYVDGVYVELNGRTPDNDHSDQSGGSSSKPGPGTATYGNSSTSSQGSEDAGLTTGDFTPSGGEWTGGNGSQGHGTPDPSLPDNPDYTGVQPILLDLDGNGIRITELSQSTHFVDATGDGLQNSTAWAGAGDAVLFYDPARPGHPDGLNDIVETSQYIFSEWDPTAASDIEALRAVFDSNGDGVLNASDAAFADFKLMVTNADGSTSVMTLAAAGITEIDLTGDATHIELPDGSVITGQTTFTRDDGSTGTVGDVTLAADGQSYRVVQNAATDGNGVRTETSTGYNADGSIGFVITSVTSANGTDITNSYDDNGDGVVDRLQRIVTVTNSGAVTETVENRVGSDLATAVLVSAKATTTSADGSVVTIQRDSSGGGWYDQEEVRTTHTDDSVTIVVSDLSESGAVLASSSETVSANGLTRTEVMDADGDGDADVTDSETITINVDGSRDEEVITTRGHGGSIAEIGTVTTGYSADGQTKTVTYDLDGDGDTDLVEDLEISTTGTASSSSREARSGDGTLLSSETHTTSSDALTKSTASDVDGDGGTDVAISDVTVLNVDGSRENTVTVTNNDGSVRDMVQTTLGADKVSSETWVDLNQNGIFESTDLVESITVDGGTGERTQMVWSRNPDGSINGKVVSVTSADGLSSETLIDADGDGDTDLQVLDETVVNGDGSTTQTIVAKDQNGALENTTVIVTSADGLNVTAEIDIDGDAILDAVSEDNLVLNADGSTVRTVSTYAGNGTALLSETNGTALLSETVVEQSSDRRDVTVSEDFNGDGAEDLVTHSVEASDGSVEITETAFYKDGSQAAEIITTISANGLVVSATSDTNGDDVDESVVTSTMILNDDGSRTETVDTANGDASVRSGVVTNVSANGLQTVVDSDLDGDGTYERSATRTTVLNSDGSVTDTSEIASADDTLLGRTATTVSGNGLEITEGADIDGDGTVDLTTTTVTVLQTDGGTSTTTTLVDAEDIQRNSVTISISDNARSITTQIDENGDTKIDTEEDYELQNDGVQVTTTSSYDTNGDLMSRSYFELSDDGLNATTKTDFDGDDIYDSVAADTTQLNADGSTTRTVEYKSSDGSIYSTSVTGVSDDGLTVTQEEDYNNDGAIDLTTVSTSELAIDGILTETVVQTNADGDTIYSSSVVTSADQYTSTLETDVDGNGELDLRSITSITDSGVRTNTSTYYTNGGGIEAIVKTAVSGDGLSSVRSLDGNGDGNAELITSDVTTLGQDGTVSRSVEYRTYRNVTLGHEDYFTSDDGFYSTASLDLDGDDVYEFVTEDTTVFEDDGDVVRTLSTRDASFDTLSEIATVTSGNGLVSSHIVDFNGDGSVDRTQVTTLNADGSSVDEVLQYGGGYQLQASTVVTVSADGRRQEILVDLDGDGHIDQRQVSQIDLNRTETVTMEDIALDGTTDASVTTATIANGTFATAKFDVDGDGNADITRSTDIRYTDAGEQISTFTESFGAGGVTAYEEVTTTAADGLSSSTAYDMDGDGVVDATTVSTITLNSNGSTLTENVTHFADGELYSEHSQYVSADERTVANSHDYDGNGIADKKSTLEIKSDGSSVQTETTFNEAGYEINTQVTATSNDGLTTTIQRSDNVQTLTRSAVDNGSYSWDNGIEAGEFEIHITSTHEVDALGIETWTVSQSGTKYGADISSTETVRLDQQAKAEIIAEAERIYDSVLDRGMDVGEQEVLIAYVVDGELDSEALTADLLLGIPTWIYDLWGISLELALEIGFASLMPSEFDIRYGELNDAEFVNQIYLNTYGRAPSMAELDVLLEALSSGDSTREGMVVDLANSVEHLAVGNGHRITNNFDVILNPAEYERSINEEYVRSIIENMVDVVYDRDATAQEIAYLSELLMTGEDNPEDIATILLGLDGAMVDVAANSLSGRTGDDFVTQAFINAYGRPPSAEELQAWGEKIASGEITQAQFVASLAESTEHRAFGNDHVAVLPTETYTLQEGSNGADTLNGTTGADKLLGNDGIDTLIGGDGNDWIEGGDGFDSLQGDAGNDILKGGALADELLGGHGADLLQGDGGIDALQGGSGSDTYVWTPGDGSDTIYDDGTSCAETDTLILSGVTTADVTLSRPDGTFDLLIAIATPGNLEFITVTDHFKNSSNGVGIEEIMFDDGVWTLEDILNQAANYGDGDANTLEGVSDFDETFYGYVNDDIIDAKGGDDTIVGGVGDDTLKGGDGSDAYFWSRGDGDDTINDSGASQTEDDHLVLTDVDPDDVTLTREDGTDDLLVTIFNASGQDEVITVYNQFDSSGNGKGIEVIEFADDVVWTLEDILANTTINGGVTGDTLHGTELADIMLGKAGDDTLTAGDGDDLLTGGLGTDTLWGQNGNDTYFWSLGDGSDEIKEDGVSLTETDRLIFGDVTSDTVSLTRLSGSNDLIITIGSYLGAPTLTIDRQFETVTNGRGLEEIEFSDGVVWTLEDIISHTDVIGTSGQDTLTGLSDFDETFHGLASVDTINGNGGDDTLIGGGGNDVLNGGSGNDLYIWSIGDDSDTINDSSTSTSEVDTLKFTDVDEAHTALSIDGEDLIISISVEGGLNQQIIVEDRFNASGNGNGIEIIEFSTGVRTTVLAGPDFEAVVLGTIFANNPLNGWAYTDIIFGLGGADVINGLGGDDRIIGGSGNDTLDGGTGNDSYEWSIGHGYDTIHDTGTATFETDTLVLTDVASGDVYLRHGSGDDDLVINVVGGATITVQDQFGSTTSGVGIEAITFSDGVTWDLDDIFEATLVVGSLGDDTLVGVNANFAEHFEGYLGADTITANGGDDTLDGGGGEDTLKGGAGSDSYLWTRGDDNDEIDDGDAALGDTDTLVLSDVLAADVSLSRADGATDLIVTISGGTGADEVITVSRQFEDAASGYGIEAIEFSDGEIWTLNDIIASTLISGSTGADTLDGESAFGETFEGLEGDDTINGNGGDDTLIGGDGSDILRGGVGNDTYLWSRADDDDTINDAGIDQSEADRLVLTDVNASEVTLTRADESNDLIISISGVDGADITVVNQYLSSTSGNGIEVIEFADTVWTIDDIEAATTVSDTEFDQLLTGNSAFDENFLGLTGWDTINAGDGDDILNGGEGKDTLNGGNGVDTASYVDSDQSVTVDLNLVGAQAGSSGQEEFGDVLTDIENLSGSAFADTLTGDDAANILWGNDGADTLSGGAGFDQLFGGLGNDTLTGGADYDEFFISVGDGADTITDFEDGLDQIVINGLTVADLTISQSGADTLITLDGGATTITLQNIDFGNIGQDDFQFV